MGLRRSSSRKGGVHTPEGSWSISRSTFAPRSNLAVYDRQAFRAPVLGAGAETGATTGVTFFEDDSVRIWHQNDDVLILSFKTKMHVIGPGVVAGMEKAIAEAEKNFKGLVIWHADAAEGGAFSAGADLQSHVAIVYVWRRESDRTSSISIAKRTKH